MEKHPRKICDCHSELVGFYMQEAIKLKPNFADAHLNQGNVLKVNFCCLELYYSLSAMESCAHVHLLYISNVRLWEGPKRKFCAISKPFK